MGHVGVEYAQRFRIAKQKKFLGEPDDWVHGSDLQRELYDAPLLPGVNRNLTSRSGLHRASERLT
ncbi:hypothetical protein KIN_18130 [Litoreibacter roseus]|uniref:Uncharacterized protein n=1 Tax=Litoreibacter roseus TaxID=2601869 RepID=A0A6N6JH76_9RHOB|nr:hypothetical protein KIN_18130 [Litoreibacter roseus]